MAAPSMTGNPNALFTCANRPDSSEKRLDARAAASEAAGRARRGVMFMPAILLSASNDSITLSADPSNW